MDPTLALTAALSVFVGVALGLLGGGGSILTVPILLYAAHLPAHQAIATSLFVVGVTSAAALVPHARAGRVRLRTGLVFGVSSMFGAYLAGSAAKFLPGYVLLLAFGTMMLVTAVAMLRRRPATDPSAPPAAPQALWKILLEGLVVGAVTGLVGAGGGFLVVPALVLFGGLTMRDAVGTSLLVIAMKAFAGFAGYVGSVSIDWTIALVVAAAAVAGSLVGGLFVSYISQRALRKAFAFFVLVMAVFVLLQELAKLLHVGPSDTSWWLLLGALLAPVVGLSVREIRRAQRERSAAGAPSPLAPDTVPR